MFTPFHIVIVSIQESSLVLVDRRQSKTLDSLAPVLFVMACDIMRIATLAVVRVPGAVKPEKLPHQEPEPMLQSVLFPVH